MSENNIFHLKLSLNVKYQLKTYEFISSKVVKGHFEKIVRRYNKGHDFRLAKPCPLL